MPDLAGPTVYPLTELVRSYLTEHGKRRPFLPVPLPGKPGKAYKSGANLNLQAVKGERTWEAFVAEKIAEEKAAAAK